MSIRSRQILLGVLTGIFLTQTWLVYVDAAGRQQPPLSALATRGQEVWHRHNCQSCHQIYGFGGFLGPDLTNLARRMASSGEEAPGQSGLAHRLATVLTTGSERMPAFHLEVDEREALAAFFEELDRTGTGQIQVSEGAAPKELFEGLVEAAVVADGDTTDLVQRGREVATERGCIDCHLPNGRSSFRATDLTRIHSTVDPDRVATVLAQGIPEKGMPSFGLDPADVEAVAAFLELLARRGTDIRQGFEAAEDGSSGSLMDLPWFEYP